MSMLLWMSPVFHNISMILSQKNHQKAIPPPLDLKVASKELSLSTVSLEPWLCQRTLAEQRLLREPPGSSTFQLVASTERGRGRHTVSTMVQISGAGAKFICFCSVSIQLFQSCH